MNFNYNSIMTEQRLPPPAPLRPFTPPVDCSHAKICQWYCCGCGQAYGTVGLLLQSTDACFHPSQSLPSDSSIDSSSSTSSTMTDGCIVLPNRFDCARCKHLMCPYCLKVRYGDLVAGKLLPRSEKN